MFFPFFYILYFYIFIFRKRSIVPAASTAKGLMGQIFNDAMKIQAKTFIKKEKKKEKKGGVGCGGWGWGHTRMTRDVQARA